MVSALTHPGPLVPPPAPPFALMEVLRLGQGALLGRGLGRPPANMTFSRVRDEISKSIRPVGPARPRHPPQDAWGSIPRVREPSRLGQHTREAAKAAGLCPVFAPSYQAQRGPTPPCWPSLSTEPLPDLLRMLTCEQAVSSTGITPGSYMGKLRTERLQKLAQSMQLSGADLCPQGLCLYL